METETSDRDVCPECSGDPNGVFECVTGSREEPDARYRECSTCGNGSRRRLMRELARIPQPYR